MKRYSHKSISEELEYLLENSTVSGTVHSVFDVKTPEFKDEGLSKNCVT